jgi:hypothetical protein
LSDGAADHLRKKIEKPVDYGLFVRVNGDPLRFSLEIVGSAATQRTLRQVARGGTGCLTPAGKRDLGDGCS